MTQHSICKVVVTIHTVPEQELKISKKNDHMETWTFYLRQLSLFARLSYYFIAVLGLTKSSTLLSALRFGQHSASFHMVIENVTDIFFPKWALLERCVLWTQLADFGQFFFQNVSFVYVTKPQNLFGVVWRGFTLLKQPGKLTLGVFQNLLSKF